MHATQVESCWKAESLLTRHCMHVFLPKKSFRSECIDVAGLCQAKVFTDVIYAVSFHRVVIIMTRGLAFRKVKRVQTHADHLPPDLKYNG